MIVNTVPQGWEIIYQQAHGVLAAQLAYHLKPELQCSHWVETLLAIGNHDNRQKTWRGHDGLTEAGAPADFTQLPVSLEQAQALAHAVRFQSRWVTLLTSMHLSLLYEPLRGTSNATDTFLDEQLELQKNCRKSLNIKLKEAQQAYAILNWCDSLSLLLCKNELPAGARAIEIAQGPDGKTYTAWQLADGDVQVQPWPFAEKKLCVHVEYRLVKQLQFQNDAQLAEVLHQTQPLTRNWWLCSNNR
ncbi:DUF3891 family protein [Pontibacter qinzhouensis]|uniref:DUF3891 family protein n=1 Tax=Pontibacter qinzhouensis TaxID=2603253 RepID=A0A5C8K861_9BACT|nr:DUF3891 family protein [Pontibacter qinzhouensis]TXK45350.1 DUF3891 family protein [Pontibacter qinzhouensis]